ncbi:MAG TPA: bifunctional phosphopantothenoylcysteine decarboxylase/phosphopantothenate--cysteine ligase CoaBC [Myxococcaceae bacterium]|nr:bifunctional phosphopantothenoylcysteine decarboxylase/phosphopantothenate--cysteine ligase CoaBC [Myxococcaceae bacterium]
MVQGALKGRRVVVGVGGGIAAYKSCELVRALQREGAEVRVMLTEAAQAFVTPLTFQALSGHPPLTHAYDPEQEAGFGHIDLARWAELIVIAPATANLIGRLRMGLADDAVTTVVLASRARVVLAPAMNTVMYENARTQENLATLAADPRFTRVEPEAGLLACGEIGAGRLAAIPEIVSAVARQFGPRPLEGRRVLITAGPTREHLDPVRFLSNPSTGRMGLAMASAAQALGAEVTVVLGPVAGSPPGGLDIIPITTAEELAEAVLARVGEVDYFVSTAAVSDWRPATRAAQKRKKVAGEKGETLELVRTPDVLLMASEQVHRNARRPVLVGFAAETERVLEYAREKLQSKRLDAIVANDVSGPDAGFAAPGNRVWLLTSDETSEPIEGSKEAVAARLWEALARLPPPAQG